MLRRLDVRGPWRSLDTAFWPDEFPAGSRTIVYGHNGGGKSTVSELLLSLAEGVAATDVIWEDEQKERSSVSARSSGPAPSVAVFTRKWVDANLSAFLDGAGASAIVTLGREAIDAKEQEARLVAEIEALRADASEADKSRKSAVAAADKITRTVQDRIVSELKEFDYAHYTKNRYSVPRVQDELRAYKGGFPDSNAHAEALKRLGEGAPSLVADVLEPPARVRAVLAGLPKLLAETPTRAAIERLERDPAAQRWVERGIELHGGLDSCLFCANEITAERRLLLARRFDESWMRIRSSAESALSAATREKDMLLSWLAAMPEAASLAGDLQPVYEDAFTRVHSEVDQRVAALESVEAALAAKASDPSQTPLMPDVVVLESPPSIVVLAEAVREHNERARRHADVTAEHKRTVFDHLVGSHSETFRRLQGDIERWNEKVAAGDKALRLAERRLEEVRQSRFTTRHMAETLTRDLARVYGKNHLSVVVTPDGKSYACRRGDGPGTDLSDGERTTLSLLYFLRKLEDEQVPDGDPSQRIVVVDDPSSSLDREALFATHQWLLDTLTRFGQFIILTHDFSLLRLFMKSQKNAWGNSVSRIRKGDLDEERFPRVSFLEIFASSTGGKRGSKIGKLPTILLKNTSEYAYLFSMVMAGVADSEDHERLFLLPNAARRVLEVFASYKAPHRTDFLQQLEVLVEAQDGEPFRDVYDFCNRFSHGEGAESVDVLDARVVSGQIRRCMEFLRAVDPEHFERMCNATDTDPASLP